MKTTNKIIVAAHCDDIMLSLGGILLKKGPFKVIDIFSTCAWSIDKKLKDHKKITALNKQEEKQAINQAGSNLKMFDFPEVLLRGYKDWNAEIANSVSEKEINKKVFQIIKKYYKKAASLYFPLAVGSHLDHKTIFNQAIKLLSTLKKTSKSKNVFFYEDLPYSADYSANKQINILLSNSIFVKPVLINITKYIDKKIQLLSLYKTQLDKKELKKVRLYAKNLSPENDYHERLWQVKK